MMNKELSQIFEQLSSKLKESGQIQEITLESTLFKVYRISEVSLQVEISNNLELPSGISFEALDDELFLTPDGSISVSDEVDDEVSVYSLSDEETIKLIYLFLRWRLTAMTKLDM